MCDLNYSTYAVFMYTYRAYYCINAYNTQHLSTVVCVQCSPSSCHGNICVYEHGYHSNVSLWFPWLCDILWTYLWRSICHTLCICIQKHGYKEELLCKDTLDIATCQ